MSFKVGDAITVKPHIRHQYLSHGAVIEPTIQHQRDGYRTTIQDIYLDEMEDANGNPVVDQIIVTAKGEMFSSDEVELA